MGRAAGPWFPGESRKINVGDLFIIIHPKKMNQNPRKWIMIKNHGISNCILIFIVREILKIFFFYSISSRIV